MPFPFCPEIAPAQESHECIGGDSQDAQSQDTGQHDVGTGHFFPVEDEIPQSCRGGNHFRPDEGPPAVSQADAQSRVHGRKGLGKADMPENCPGRQAIDAAHFQQLFIGMGHAIEGIEEYGEKCRQDDDDDFAGLADAEPQDGDGHPGDGRPRGS